MISCHHDTATHLQANMTDLTCGTDGALERMLRLGHRNKHPPAIFIHAGAGFHSHQNEKVHLEACVS